MNILNLIYPAKSIYILFHLLLGYPPRFTSPGIQVKRLQRRLIAGQILSSALQRANVRLIAANAPGELAGDRSINATLSVVA